jgi:uncharacterized protein (TIGR02246 family)
VTSSSGDVVDRQVAAYNARDVDAFAACYADDVVVEELDGATLIEGIDDLRRVYGEFFAASPDLHADVRSRVVLGGTVIDEEQITGMNAPDTPSEMRAVVIYRVRGGKIARVRMVSAD